MQSCDDGDDDDVVLLVLTVQGCRKVVAPPGGWVSVDGNTATVRCNVSRETWYLTCSGSRWMGQAGNCSSKGIFFLTAISITTHDSGLFQSSYDI